MNTEYHHWFSRRLGREMELKVYGHYGKPMLVFPAQSGRFFDFEGFGMIDAVRSFIDEGRIKVFTVDSVDAESWCNHQIHPADRARRHDQYDDYVVSEVVPFIHHHCGNTWQKPLTTGCSMGAYHAANFFFRHPDLFDATICLSGLYQMKGFVGDYMDERVYFNSPLAFLQNLTDPGILELYRRSFIVICTGQGAWEEGMIADARAMQDVLGRLGVPAWIDFWGYDVNHDWPWWQRQLPYFLSRTPGVGF